MDIEWGRTASTVFHILQARETVKSQDSGLVMEIPPQTVRQGAHHGRAIGQKIGAGVVRIAGDASR